MPRGCQYTGVRRTILARLQPIEQGVPTISVRRKPIEQAVPTILVRDVHQDAANRGIRMCQETVNIQALRD